MANESILRFVNGGGYVYADVATVTFNFNMQVFNASYTHTVDIKRGSTTILSLSLGSLPADYTSKSVTLSSAQRTTLLNSMTDVAWFTATYVLTTYNNNTVVGTSTYEDVIATTSANSGPTANAFTYKDTNATSVAMTGNNQVLIAGVSTLQINGISGSARNGASLVGFKVNSLNTPMRPSGTQYISPSATTYDYGTYAYGYNHAYVPDRIWLRATDSRGYEGWSYTEVATVYQYSNPQLENYSVRRASDQTKVNLSFSGTFSNILTNTVSLKYRYKEAGGSYNAYTTVSPTTSGGTFTYTASNLGTFDLTKTYEFEVVVTDTFNSTTVTITVPTRESLISFRGQALGLGTIPTTDHVIEVGSEFALHANGMDNMALVMPYGFSTNGGQSAPSSFTYAPGYVRIARVQFLSGAGQQLGPSTLPIKFKLIAADRAATAELTMRFNGYWVNATDLHLSNATVYFNYSNVSGLSYGDSSFFVKEISGGLFDFYAQLNDVYDHLTVYTYAPEKTQGHIKVIYEDDYIATADAPAASSTVKYATAFSFNKLTVENGSLVATGKNNVMNYMPYSWEAKSSEDPQAAGYMRIATVSITGNYCINPIVFEVYLRGTGYKSILYLSFTSTDGTPNNSGTEPTINGFVWEGNRVCSAYVIRTSAYVWDVYIQKQSTNERATVYVYTSANFQSKANITYTTAPVVSSIPSGATTASIPSRPPIRLQSGQYYSAGNFSLDMNNSDIIGANSIYFRDVSDGWSEGVHFIDSNSKYDTIYALNGVPYFMKTHSVNANDGTQYEILTTNSVRDYVTAEWDENDWHCVAWKNGRRECWKTITYAVPANGWSAWGSVYEAQPTTAVQPAYPSSFFGSAPTLQCTVTGTSGAIGYELYGNNTKTQAPKIIVLRPNSLGSAATFYVHLYAIGSST